MAAETSFDYYYGDESNQFSFYRIPRQLVTGDRFKRLSTDAKLLYGLLLDRMGLSANAGLLVHLDDGQAGDTVHRPERQYLSGNGQRRSEKGRGPLHQHQHLEWQRGVGRAQQRGDKPFWQDTHPARNPACKSGPSPER